MDETERFKRIASRPQSDRDKWLWTQKQNAVQYMQRMLAGLDQCKGDGLINDEMTLPQIVEAITKACEDLTA